MIRTLMFQGSLIVAGLGFSMTAAAQNEWLVNGVVLQLDVGILDDGVPVHSHCSALSPCANATLLIDTPVWLDTETDLAVFREDVHDLLLYSEDENAFLNEPTLVFGNLLGTDPVQFDYATALIDELDAANSNANVWLSE